MNPVMKHKQMDRQQEGAALFGELFCSVELEFLNRACRWLATQFGAPAATLHGQPVHAFFAANQDENQFVPLAKWRSSLCSCDSGILTEIGLEAEETEELDSAACCQLNSGDYLHPAAVCQYELGDRDLTLYLHDEGHRPGPFYHIDLGECDARCPDWKVREQLSSERLRLVLERTRIELNRYRESRQRNSELSTLQSAIACFPGLVFAKDMDLRYVVVNKTLCEYNRLKPEEIRGKRFNDLPGLNASSVIEWSDHKALQGQPVTKEHELTYFGEPRYFRGQKSPILDQDGEQVGICGVYHDITDLREAERKLQKAIAFQAAVIEKASEGVAVIQLAERGRTFKIAIWNQRLSTITGVSPGAGIDRRFLELFASNRLAALRCLSRLRRGIDLDQEEWAFRHPDGEDRIVVVSTTSIQEVDSEPSILFFVNDITRHHRIQQALVENQQRYELATKYSKSCVWEWHVATNAIEHCTLAETLGYEGLTFRTIEQWMEKIHLEDQPFVRQAWSKFLSQESPAFHTKMRMLHASGSWRWIDCHGQFLDGDPNSGIVFGTDRDVTDQITTAYRVKELQDEMQKISRLTTVSEMAASLAHEITQPVTAMRSYAAATRKLLDEAEEVGHEADIKRYVGKIEENAKNATEIMHVVRSLCSPAAMVLSRGVLGDITKKAMEVCEVELRRRQIEIVHLSGADDKTVHVSTSLIVHVLMNLISNACDALDEMPLDGRMITIKTDLEDDKPIILLSDNGPGISREIGSTLFQPFVTTKTNGMGVGLAICKRIMDAHNGEISVVESHAGSGATFRLRFS